MKAFANEQWSGANKIVIGIDIGTTHSAVSYAYLYPEGPQAVSRVGQWPGQEAHRGESKIPTLVWYDKNKKAVSFGAEAMSAEAEDDARDNGWKLAKHFKLHLHPKSMQAKHNLKVPPLPEGITLEKIYEDFLGYIFKHTRTTFESRVPAGAQVWKSYFSQADIVLAHPNGWGLKEQEFLRKAAISAGLVSHSSAANQVYFISEAEASTHFCMFHADLAPQFKPGVEFLVCDAGGSTVDTTAYKVSSNTKFLQMEELKPSACIQAGAIFVNMAAEEYLRKKFDTNSEPYFKRVFGSSKISKDDVKEYLSRGIHDFELNAKKAFVDPQSKSSIDLGSTRFTHAELGVRRGRMSLEGSTVESFFRPCVNQIITSIRDQMLGMKAQHILLVGGFGDSMYLRENLLKTFGSNKCHVITVNDSTSKAVSDGAVIWHTKRSVTARAARFSYGINVWTPSISGDASYVGRKVVRLADGTDSVDYKWSPLIKRGTVVEEKEGVVKAYRKTYKTNSPVLDRFSHTIYAFTHIEKPEPFWLCDSNEKLSHGFEVICKVTGDLSALSGALQKMEGPDGPYWQLNFEIGVEFGGTALNGFMEWTENGTKRRGPATIMPHSLE